MFSFSSPPQSNLYQRPTSYAFAPTTPSPLRTSHNANRGWMENRTRKIQSSPLSDTTTFDTVEQDENTFSPQQSPHLFFTSLATPSHTVDNNQKGSLFTLDHNTTTPSTGNSASSSSSTSKLFAFEQRARSSSPTAQLSQHATDSRERRKNMFLDRLRSKREDRRESRMGDQMLKMGDQILRMDYVREMRAWEEKKSREEGKPNEPEEGDGDLDVDMDMALEDQPSPTEEREIEELVSYLEDSQNPGDDIAGSDDEYDQLFMELSADQGDGGGMDVDMS